MENVTLTWMDFYGFEMRRVNESTIVQLASWEVSFWKQLVNDSWHVAMGLDLWNIGMVFTSISPFFMCSIHLQIEKKSSRVTHACIDLFLPRTCKNLALTCNKTWDDGRRETIGLSSLKTYEKNNKQLLIKKNPKKIEQSKIHFIPAQEQCPSRLTNGILIIASSFLVQFEWFQIQMKLNL